MAAIMDFNIWRVHLRVIPTNLQSVQFQVGSDINLYFIRGFIETHMKLNPLNPAGRFSGLGKRGGGGGGPKTRRTGFPAFSMVCAKPEEHLNRGT